MHSVKVYAQSGNWSRYICHCIFHCAYYNKYITASTHFVSVVLHIGNCLTCLNKSCRKYYAVLAHNIMFNDGCNVQGLFEIYNMHNYCDRWTELVGQNVNWHRKVLRIPIPRISALVFMVVPWIVGFWYLYNVSRYKSRNRQGKAWMHKLYTIWK